MPCLAYVMMPSLEAQNIHAGEEMKYRPQEFTCVSGRERIGGFDDDERQPDSCRNPCLQDLLFSRCAQVWCDQLMGSELQFRRNRCSNCRLWKLERIAHPPIILRVGIFE